MTEPLQPSRGRFSKTEIALFVLVMIVATALTI